MKILMLLKKWEGGVGTVIKDVSEEFRKLDHEVKIISREDDLKINSLKKSIFPFRKIVKNLVKNKKFDIIYSADWSSAFPLFFPYPIFKKKHFCTFYGEDKKIGKKLQTLIGRFMGKRLIVCNDKLKIRFPPANLIYNRVNHNRFSPSSKTKRIKNSVGFANWKTEEYKFNEIKKAVDKLRKKLIIAEGVPKEKMPDFFRKLEYFISLPPSYAGFGLVYLEAMASGVPKIIGSGLGGGEKLPITKIEDYKDLGEAISKAEKKDYRKWVINNNFTWEDAVKKIATLFRNTNNL